MTSRQAQASPRHGAPYFKVANPPACVIFAEPGVAKRQQANPARSERKQR